MEASQPPDFLGRAEKCMVRLTTAVAIFNIYGFRRIVVHDGLGAVARRTAVKMRPDMEARLIPARVLIIDWIAYRSGSDGPIADLPGYVLDQA
jgi:hypothetical protein